VDPGDRPAATSTAGPAPGSAPDGVQPGQGRQEALQHQPAPFRLVGLVEDAVHYLVTLLLLGVAVVVLYRTGRALFDSQLPFPENVTTVVNGALFVVIVMEVLRTVVAHFEHTGFQLQPLLIIGIVSAREIRTVGARLSLAGDKAPSALRNALLELGVHAGVVLGLATALVLIRRGAGMRET